ncbi:MAG: hypothetical protein WCJ35_03260 [Planctomycetota bacterium]
MAANLKNPKTWGHVFVPLALAAVATAGLFLAARFHGTPKVIEVASPPAPDSDFDKRDFFSMNIENATSSHRSGHLSPAPRANANPFRVVSNVPGFDEENYVLDIEFNIADVDFFSQVTGEVANETPSTVIAEGTGATAEKAHQDAVRECVRQLVRQLVEVENLLRWQEQIERDLLDQSDRFVVECRQLAQDKKGETYRIRVIAKVNRSELVRALRKASVPLETTNE